MELVKNYSKKLLSLFLAILMLISVIPMGVITASAEDSIENAVKWAIKIANDDSHGYSLGGKGPTDYDCQGFVCTAFKQAGFSVYPCGTANMKNVFTKAGFKCYTYGNVTLKRGDVLLRYDSKLKKGHTEIYIGDNKCVAAHDNYDGVKGDTGKGKRAGEEIEVRTRGVNCTTCSNMQYVLRYNGDTIKTEYDLHWPVDTTIGKITSGYGPRNLGYGSKNHRGIDIGCVKKDVYAAESGTVTATGVTDYRGRYILVYHKDIGLTTLYQHLNKSYVKKGDTVKRGDVIAQSGESSDASGGNKYGYGKHLHFGIIKGKATSPNKDQPSYNLAINPLGTNISYNKKKAVSYKISSQNDEPSKRTNTTNEIVAKLDNKATIEYWGYYYGKSATEVEKHNKKTNNSNSKFVYVHSSSEKNISSKEFRTTVKGLTPKKNDDDKYWYVIEIKIKGIKDPLYTKKFYGLTTNIKPDKTTVYTTSGSSNIGLSDSASVYWAAAKNANSYTVSVYNSSGTEVHKETGIKGTKAGIPAKKINKVDTYTVKLTAVNEAGSTVCDSKSTITVHNDVNVEFVNHVPDVTEKDVTIETKSVHYGHNVTAPAIPNTYGYTFKSWDKGLNNITSNTKISTIYTPNKYTVKFVNGLTGAVIGQSQKIEYKKSAVAPDVSNYDTHNFIGWDKDYTCITEDTVITANYEWYDKEYPVKITSSTATKITKRTIDLLTGNNVTGYEIKINVTNNDNDDTQGRFVVQLLSPNGTMLTETESSAFSLLAKESKIVNVFVPYSYFAYKAVVYCVNDYGNTGILCAPFEKIIDNSDAWSAGTTTPIVEKDGIVVKTEQKPTKITQYRYRTQQTTTSYSNTMSGWTLASSKYVSQGQTTNNYSSTGFPSGFDKNNYYYKTYNNKKVSAKDDGTTKIVIDSDTSKGYVYWHWCRGASVGAINRSIDWKSGTTFKKFHAFDSTTKKSYDSGANAYKWQKTDKCNDTYWWNGYETKKDKLVSIGTQKYTTYKKQYTFTKWGDWSSWSTTKATATTTKQVESRVVDGPSVTYYYSKSADPELAEPEITDREHQIVNINGTVDTAFANKSATVFIYKYTQSSDYTNEYIGNTTVGENGEIKIDGAVLKEAPSIETGDFTIAVAIKGNSEAIEIGKIEAPKPHYTVTFYDYSEDSQDKKIIYQAEDIEAGSTVIAPSSDLITMPDGYKFSYWDQSTVNINDNLEVYPICEKETYVVTFVDWNTQTVSMEERQYGDEVNPPEIESAEGIDTYWDFGNAHEENGVYTIVENTVITTIIDTITNTAVFLSTDVVEPNAEPEDVEKLIDSTENGIEEFVDNGNAEVVQTEYEDRIDIPIDIYNDDQYLFIGWKNVTTGEYLEDTTSVENSTYYPVYEFAETVEIPEADVKTGEYDSVQTVTLSCATENAVIYYTTDGTNPETSETAVEYTEAITLSKSCTLKFCAMAIGMNNSGTVAELYAINTATSGVRYHLVSVYSNLPEQEGEYYQTLIKEGTLFNDVAFKNVVGHTYDGLFYDKELTDEFYVSAETITETTVLYAGYTPKQYTATFVDSDGTTLGTSTVNFGETAETPIPIKEEYVFIGWDSDDYLYMTEDNTFTAQYCLESEYATVSLNKSKMTVYVDSSIKLKATVTPSDNDTEVSWESSDWNVAEVDNDGVVTLIATGTATITVTVESTGESAQCVFNVVNSPETNIVLSSSSKLDVDLEGYLRRIPAGANTVAEIKAQFVNDNLSFFDANGVELTDTDLVGTGSLVQLIVDGELQDELTVIMTGDYDGDGKIQNKDVSMLSQFLVEKRESTYPQQLAMDANGDGYVNVRDSAMLSRYLVGKEKL